jgi:hypothetical protein
MKLTLSALAIAVVLSTSVQAIADDSPSSDTAQTKKQSMKDCMAKQKATNSSMTEDAMKTVCKNQLHTQKSIKNGNDLSTGPQNQSAPPQQ